MLSSKKRPLSSVKSQSSSRVVEEEAGSISCRGEELEAIGRGRHEVVSSSFLMGVKGLSRESSSLGWIRRVEALARYVWSAIGSDDML